MGTFPRHGSQAGKAVLHEQRHPPQATVEQIAIDLLPVLKVLGALLDLAAEDLFAAQQVDAHHGVDGTLDEALAAVPLDVLGVHEDGQAVGRGGVIEQVDLLDEAVEDVLEVDFGNRDAPLAL